MKHESHRMHENSLDSYHAQEAKLSARCQAIYRWVEKHGPHTDREVAYAMGFGENLNAVRPRITELIEEHHQLMQVTSRMCPITKRKVRVVDISRPRGQESLQ